MTGNDGTTAWDPEGAVDNKNGADITDAELQFISGFPEGFDQAPWTYLPGRLPGLNDETVEIPGHLSLREPDVNFPAGKGDGSPVFPYQITSVEELALLATLVNANNATYNAAHYKLMNNLDLNVAPYNIGEGWTPIGATANPFRGVFDGGGNTVSGLFINRTAGNDQGLFGCIMAPDAIIKNLGASGNITTTGARTGGIVGYVQQGSIDNCWFSGSLTNPTNGNVGGVAGLVGTSATVGTVSNCWSDATITCSNIHVGGLVGCITGKNAGELSTVVNSYATGSVTSGDSRAGGLIGMVQNGSIRNCYATGDVTGPNINSANTGGFGGLIGLAYLVCHVENCYATGKVTIGSANNDTKGAGGIVGYSLTGTTTTITNCLALNPSVTGNANRIGRILGFNATVGGETLSGNMAFSGMTGNDGAVTWDPEGAADNKNGAGLTDVELQVISGFPNGFDQAPWTYLPGRLPGLNERTVEMPDHLRVWEPDANFPAGKGDGSPEFPFQITSVEELALLATLVNAGNAKYNAAHYRLMNNLSLNVAPYNTGEGWMPIGTATNPFRGVFDGGENTVSGLIINRTGTDRGLFGCVMAPDAIIRNLGASGNITSSGNRAGGLVGYLQQGAIDNCWFSGSLSDIPGGHVGGLVGQAGVAGGSGYVVTISNCWSDATITCSNLMVGGLLGSLLGKGPGEPSSLVNSYATGSVTTGDSRAGGLVGMVQSGSVRNCYATGDVTGNNNTANAGGYGGLIGFPNVFCHVENCYATGKVSVGGSNRDDKGAGGLVGYSFDNTITTITNCVALNPGVTGNASRMGRIFGFNATASSETYPITFSGNMAFNAMTGNGGTITWDPKGAADNKNGANVGVQIKAAGFFQSVFEGDDVAKVWTFAEDRLPGLNGNTVEMPEHLALAQVVTVTITTEPDVPMILAGGSFTISTEVYAPDGGTLTYQWFRNASESNEGGEAISGANADTYSPDTSTEGIYYFYVEVTNSIGENFLTTTTKSQTVKMEVLNNRYCVITVTVNKNGEAWDNHGKTFTLKLSTNESEVVTMSGTGSTLTASANEGTWKIYDGDNNTGVTIEASNNIGSATLNYFSISYEVKNYDFATGSTIAATYNGTAITNGAVVLGGKTLVITATGAGAKSYTYQWSGTATGSGNTYTVDVVDAAVNAICTVTGSNQVTSAEDMPANPLKAYVNNGILHVSGLTQGKVWNLYNASGALVKQGITNNDPVTISLDLPGMYIIQSEGKTLKVVYQ